MQPQPSQRIHLLTALVAGVAMGGLVACGTAGPAPVTSTENADLYITDEQELKIANCVRDLAADAGVDPGSQAWLDALKKCLEDVKKDVADVLADAGVDVPAVPGVPAVDLDAGIPGLGLGDAGPGVGPPGALPDGGVGVCPSLFICPGGDCRCILGDNKGKDCTNPGTCESLCKVCFP